MGELRPWHVVVLVVVLVLLFGSKRLPDAARGLGRSMRILKAETRGLADDNRDAENPPAADQDANAATPGPPAVDGQPVRPPAAQPVERTREH